MTMQIRRLVFAAALAVSGCSLMTDAATRLAYDISSNADALTKSADTERTFAHEPASAPAGCAGAYQVTIDAGGSLGVGCDTEYPQVSYTTTYHRNAVTVPEKLQVTKKAGESLKVTLKKNGSAIELVRIE